MRAIIIGAKFKSSLIIQPITETSSQCRKKKSKVKPIDTPIYRPEKEMRLTTHNTIPFAKIADSRRPSLYAKKLRVERSIFLSSSVAAAPRKRHLLYYTTGDTSRTYIVYRKGKRKKKGGHKRVSDISCPLLHQSRWDRLRVSCRDGRANWQSYTRRVMVFRLDEKERIRVIALCI